MKRDVALLLIPLCIALVFVGFIGYNKYHTAALTSTITSATFSEDILSADLVSLQHAMNTPQYDSWKGEFFTDQTTVEWKQNDNTYIVFPGKSAVLKYRDQSLTRFYQKQAESYFMQHKFSLSTINTMDLIGMDTWHYRGYTQGPLLCQIRWMDGMFMDLPNGTEESGDAQSFAGKPDAYYKLEINCGYITPQAQQDFNTFYSMLKDNNSPRWVVYIDKRNDNFIFGRAGDLDTFNGGSWLAVKIGAMWKVILRKASDEQFDGTKTAACQNTYKMYQVPKDFQKIFCD